MQPVFRNFIHETITGTKGRGTRFNLVGFTEPLPGDMAYDCARVKAAAPEASYDLAVAFDANGFRWTAFKDRDALGLKAGDINRPVASGMFTGFEDLAEELEKLP